MIKAWYQASSAMVGHEFRAVEVWQRLVGPAPAQHPPGGAGLGGRTEAQSRTKTLGDFRHLISGICEIL